MLLNAIALLCVVLIGFAAHRASLCNVRAVAEAINTGRAHMLWSLLQSVLWMAALTGLLVLAFGLTPRPTLTRTPIEWAALGGVLFGVGAGVNRGCSLSTLHRLADGDLGMLATLAGFMAGVWVSLGLLPAGADMRLLPAVSPWLRWPDLAPWFGGLLFAWALWQLRKLWRLAQHNADAKVFRRALAPNDHLSVAAALLGLAAGLLYATQGAWSYSNFLRGEVLHRAAHATALSAWHGILVLGLLAGMLASALERGSLAWRQPQGLTGWARHASGGALMGLGAALVPGGNDTLLLVGLPSLAPAAVAAYVAMLLGIALVLGLMRMARPAMPVVACSPEGCDDRPGASPSSTSLPTSSVSS